MRFCTEIFVTLFGSIFLYVDSVQKFFQQNNWKNMVILANLIKACILKTGSFDSYINLEADISINS